MQVLPYFLILAPLFWPERAYAHAFGALYNLPVPFWMYLYGGAAAIVASFLLIGLLLNKKSSTVPYSLKLVNLPHSIINLLKIISVVLFFFVIFSQEYNMIFFWVFFVLGLTYLTPLIGDIYSFTNPRKILIEWIEKLLGGEIKGLFKYPKKLGYYPAFFLYFLFIWIELFYNTTPLKLSIIIIQYTILNIIGVILWGKDIWFKYCEVFSVFFQLLGKMAPIEIKELKIYLRVPFSGLLKTGAEHFSIVLFILFMLSSTAFDGFSETLPWVRFYWGFLQTGVTPPFGNSSFQIYQTLGLLISPFVLLFIYFFCLSLTKLITNTSKSLVELSKDFAYSLIPIAFAYNIAHYFTLILTEGLNIIPDANIVWHSQVGIILIGHIIGVYLSHIISLKLFTSKRGAFLSQIPQLLLMVSYTMIGLWILSQPITSGI